MLSVVGLVTPNWLSDKLTGAKIIEFSLCQLYAQKWLDYFCFISYCFDCWWIVGAMTLSMMALSIMTFSTTLKTQPAYHNDHKCWVFLILNVALLLLCRVLSCWVLLFIVLLSWVLLKLRVVKMSVVMLSVVMLSVVMLSVVKLSVVMPNVIVLSMSSFLVSLCWMSWHTLQISQISTAFPIRR
jgi:hypothetical protein